MFADSPTAPAAPHQGAEGFNGASTVSAPPALLPRQTPAAGALGNYGNLRATPPETRDKLTRSERYDLQNTAHNLVWKHVNETESKRHSFTSCGKVVGGNADYAEVRYNADTSEARLGNVATCESIACPVCAPVRAAKASATLDAAIKAALQNGQYIGHVTYTMRHDRDMSLHTSQDMFLKAQQKMRRQRAFKKLRREYGWQESVRVMEITRSDANGWHPHRHELILFGAELDYDQQQEFKRRLWIEWELALDKVGGDATDKYGLQASFGDAVAERLADYISKHGHMPDEDNPESPSAKKRGGTSIETAGGINKTARGTGLTPLQLLKIANGGDTVRGAQWLEYYLETKQRHWMSGVAKFCAAVGLDREAIEADAKAEYLAAASDYETLAIVSQEELSALVALRKRGELLEVASSGEGERVNRFIMEVMENVHRRHAHRPPPSALHRHAPIWRRQPLFI